MIVYINEWVLLEPQVCIGWQESYLGLVDSGEPERAPHQWDWFG